MHAMVIVGMQFALVGVVSRQVSKFEVTPAQGSATKALQCALLAGISFVYVCIFCPKASRTSCDVVLRPATLVLILEFSENLDWSSWYLESTEPTLKLEPHA